ncbi:aminodeoxychorismate synthase component I [Staphylospora marina]|uniref:aminodeoxychorismate synthase component I n=1 Tax=Staphylospora marina TaxID=2490858 RepID=UPI000F5BF1EA|nr:aminodeoxychorismate synthase component I [Staphylospora marina]
MEILLRPIPGDVRPESVFVHVMSRRPYAFWLDGNLPAEGLARWSFLGADPRFLVEVRDGTTRVVHRDRKEILDGNPFDAIKDIWNRFRTDGVSYGDIPFIGGFVGYFGYEMNRYAESVPAGLPDPVGAPDSFWMFADRVLIWDQKLRKAWLSRILLGGEDRKSAERDMERDVEAILRASARPLPEVPGHSRDDASAEVGMFAGMETRETYLEKIARIKEHIAAGDIYQACFTHPFSCVLHADPFELYRVLRAVNPAPFSCFLRMGDLAVCSSSPERFLKLGANGLLETRPIKGTRRRSGDEAEDRARAEELRASVKDRAENVMIVDLARHDLGKVSASGSVIVPELFRIESYATVHQLVSVVEGKLAEGVHPVDAIRASFPGGSMTGAPKIRAMEILHELETVKRGIYSGGLGYLDVRGNFDLSMVIRTVVCREDRAWFHVGGGIVADSDPDDEYRESLDKAAALKRAILLCNRRASSIPENPA